MNAFRQLYYSATAFLIVSMIGWACSNAQEKKAERAKQDTLSPKHTDILVTGDLHPVLEKSFDSSQIAAFLEKYPEFAAYSEAFHTFYRSREFKYVWYNRNGLIEPAHALIAKIEDEETEGLKMKIPYRDDYLYLFQYNDSVKTVGPMVRPDVSTELMLTAQYFNYVQNVWVGAESVKAQGLQWYLPTKKLDYAALLEENLKQGDFESMEGSAVIGQYTGLKKALAQYREIEKSGNAPLIPSLKKNQTLRLNDSSEVVWAIRKRLEQLGYTINDSDSTRFTTELAGAVSRFRAAHGYSPDSTVNSTIVAELNVPAKKRIESIMVNMERFRWVPLEIRDQEFLFVNIPAFKLQHYVDGKVEWDCDVVVGTPMTKTVIFNGQMQYIVFSPYWNVPQSIIKNEIIPGMRRDPNYLAKHRMEWNNGNVRQKPGPSNSLGLVKFLFPNSNNIYLHDTPSKSLFGKEERAFSHGCIRVAKPKELAIRLLSYDSTWTPEKIEAAMNAGVEKYVTLKKKVPVYIGYFTAFVDRNGQINFRKDIYNRDEELLKQLIQ